MPGSHCECAEQCFPGRDQQLHFREWQEKVQGSRTWRRVCCCLLRLHPHVLSYRKKNHSSSSGSLRVLLCAVGGGYSHNIAFKFICYIEAG